MNSERLWIAILALVAFAAGLAAGVLWGRETAEARPSMPFALYMERLVTEFELNADQQRDLGVALAEYDEQIERLRDESLGNLQPQLIEKGRDCFHKIREYIIPIDRRAEFDRLLGGPDWAIPPATREIH